MSNIRIEEYESSSDYFDFPYNPNTVEISTTKFVDQRKLPYSFTFMGFTSPIKSSISIGLNGHFDGTNKNSNYRSFVNKVNSPSFQKLYFQNDRDKFYLCTGMSIQKVPSGNRPLITDYVASYFSPFGMLFDATQQNGTKTSTKSNGGDIVTPIEKITGTVVSGTPVVIRDINNNGFSFTPSASGTMTYSIVKVTSEDNTTYLTEYMHIDIAGTTIYGKNASNSGDFMLTLEPGEQIVDLFTGTNGSTGDYYITGITPTFYFRNGWASD
jgi:hypothetical protein